MALQEFTSSHPILSSLALVVLLAYAYHIFYITPLPSEPPLIKGYIPFLGVFPQAILSPHRFLHACKAQHGDIFTFYVLGARVTIVTDPIEGVPAIFKQAKQLSFKAGLKTVYTKVLGMSEERSNADELNHEHFQMLPPYLLSTKAVDELTGRFVRELLCELRSQVATTPLKDGVEVDLYEWSSERVFFASANALYGEGVLQEGREGVFRNFKRFDFGFPLMMMLPMWMTNWFRRARNRIQDVLARSFIRGLVNPSSFVQRRVEVFRLRCAINVDSREVWI